MGMVSLVTDSLPGTRCKCEHTLAATHAPPTGPTREDLAHDGKNLGK